MWRTALLAILVVAACHAAPANPRMRFREASGPRHPRFIETEGNVTIGGVAGTRTTIEDAWRGQYKSTTRLGAAVTARGNDATGPWLQDETGTVVDDPAREVAFTTYWMAKRGYWKSAGARYRNGAPRTEGGGRYDIVEAEPYAGVMIELWFDAATGLLARTRRHDPDGIVVTTYSDYRTVDTTRMPFHVVTDRGDPSKLVTLDVTAIRFHDQLDDAALARPAPTPRVP